MSAKDTNEGAAIPLTFTKEEINLQPFRDEESSYAVICKACLQLTNQKKQDLVHSSLPDELEEYFQALTYCIKEHKDRRVRILALKTMAIVARSNYPRLKVSPLIYSHRDTRLVRLQDEILSEVPSAILKSAIDDPDDGVSAAAFHALGLMVATNTTTVASDDLLREINAIAFGGTPYSPTLRSVVDEDPSVMQAELSTRILENILGPRLLPIMERALLYSDTHYWKQSIHIIVETLLYQKARVMVESANLDRSTYTKRWGDIDVQGWTQSLCDSILEPALTSPDKSWVYAASLAILRLTPSARAVEQATNALLDQYPSMTGLEDKVALLATVLIGLRAKPSPVTIIEVMKKLVKLPATTLSPPGVTSAGLLVDGYRKPARMGLWGELAIMVFLDAEDGSRLSLLQRILTSSTVDKLLTNESDSNVLPIRDEFVVAFCITATYAGRRSRLADPSLASETFKCQQLLLTAFIPIVRLATKKKSYLDEDLSLLVQAQVSYVRLLQEYLHETGTLKPSVSVALKLAANALPPHLLWDSLADTSHGLQQFEASTSEIEASTKLMDQLVSTELKFGIPSHHMRLIILALAADHWCQARTVEVTEQLEGKKGTVPYFNMESANQIVMAINPKRVVKLVFDAHKSLADDSKKRKDPVKKLAIETARVCTASIENIALIACDWRRRFGSGAESKQIVSVTVGALQGKVDDTPYDDSLKAILSPVCTPAVTRVQAFYEAGSGGKAEYTFPSSELVTGQVKMKIKPLVSSTSPHTRSKDDYFLGYLTQLSRQMLVARIEQAMNSMVPVDSDLTNARWSDSMRLPLPPVSLVRDGRRHGLRGDSVAAWNRQVKSVWAGSDPVASLLAFTHRRIVRFDGEEEFNMVALFRVHNMTAIPFEQGLRFDVGTFAKEMGGKDKEDAQTVAVLEALGGQADDMMGNYAPFSATTVFRDVLESGDHVTWEVTLEDASPCLGMTLLPSITFRNVKREPDTSGIHVASVSAQKEDDNTAPETPSGEDGFQIKNADSNLSEDGVADTENVVFVGDSLSVTPMAFLQPCPMVFYRDAVGDIESFRFLWFRMVYYMPTLSVETSPQGSEQESDALATKIAKMSCLKWEGEAIPHGYASKIWAFMSLKGSRVLCLLAERDEDSGDSSLSSLHIRGDDKALLYSLVGTRLLRERLVRDLVPGLTLVA